MKIAILTQPLDLNYGGIIQSYALQQVLKDAGHEVITVNRRKSEPRLLARILSISSRTLKTILGKRKAPIFIENHYAYIYQHTRHFLKYKMHFSECITSTKAMQQYFEKEEFDAVIVGSDQVWRVDYSPNIFNYFLDFVQNTPIKKISYAASFGLSKWVMTEQETARCAELAKLFDNVSVREQEGVDLCKEYLGIEATWVCDPTLLLPKERYLSLLDDYKGKVTGNLFYYLLDDSGLKLNSLVTIAEHFQMKTYTCYPKRKHYDTESADMDEFRFPPVEQWLTSFRDAELIVTDSFHGIVFSLIFQKPFLVFINEVRGPSRIYSLMKLANFEHRLIKNESDLERILAQEDLLKPVAINKEFVEQSRVFLHSQIE